MDRLASFIIDAAGLVMAVLAALGLIAAACGIIAIFHKEIKDILEDENDV